MNEPTQLYSLWYRPHKRPNARRFWRRLLTGTKAEVFAEFSRRVDLGEEGEWAEPPADVDMNERKPHAHPSP